MAGTPLSLADAQLDYFSGWLPPPAADALLVALHSGLPWEVHRLHLFGRSVDAPRLSCWIGDPDAVYTYSRSRFLPRPWPEALQPVRDRLQREFGLPFNSVLANLYRDGRDSMGWHSDDEPELGPEPAIASLSLGAARRFLLRHRTDTAARCGQVLEHGSLLLMRGPTQRHWRHALPRTARPVGARINLTFRQVEPGRRR